MTHTSPQRKRVNSLWHEIITFTCSRGVLVFTALRAKGGAVQLGSVGRKEVFPGKRLLIAYPRRGFPGLDP